MNINTISSMCFGLGKAHVFSDFDGTYFPAKQKHVRDDAFDKNLDLYCKKMDKFFKKTEGDLNFHITTGRNYTTYKFVSELIRNKNYQLPLPQSVITQNGGDEFIRQTSSENFYAGNNFSFEYSQPNFQKELEIKKRTNWNGAELKNNIKTLAQKYNIELVEGETEQGTKEYGKLSIFCEDKLANPNKMGLRLDGNLKTHLIFPVEFNKQDEFINDIKDYLKKNNINYFLRLNKVGRNYKDRASLDITPKYEGRELTKLFDTKEAFEKAKINKDIVIAAGNDVNDFEMLNPFEYIDFQKYIPNSKNKEFYQKDMKQKLEDMKKVLNGNVNSEYIKSLRQELHTNGFIKELETIPFCGIIVGDNNSLQILVDTFSPVGKIIKIENGKLEKGIKKAIINHSKKSKSFKNGMSPKFKSYILNSRFLITKGIIISSIVLGALTTGTLFYQSRRNDKIQKINLSA